MEKKKLESTRKIQRLAALPYNPNARKDIQSIRNKYGLDKVGDLQARAWYGDWTMGVGLPLATDWTLRKFEPPRTIRCPNGTSSIVDKTGRPLKSAWQYFSPYGQLYQGEEYKFDSDIPIEKDIVVLIRRYQLPIRAFMDVLEYVLSGEMKNPSEQYWNMPQLSIMAIEPLDKKLTLRILIDRITSGTTRKQWMELWDKHLAPYFTSLHTVGALDVPPRKVTLKSMEANMKRWSEWYQLVERDGLPIGEALKQWELTHSQQVPPKFIDESTVSKAVSEFRKIIAPISIKD